MDKINTRVLIKEPRGFIRLLQILFIILAWSTTAGFTTTTTLKVFCPDSSEFLVEYKISYPFDLQSTEVTSPINCTDDTTTGNDRFPINFSSSSMLFVLVCATSLLYAIGAAAYYCFCSAKYETDPLAPMVDLGLTFMFAIFWIGITCVWSLNISDIKHYTHPNYFKDHLGICQYAEANCQVWHPGKWTSLTVSMICGLTCVVLWLGATWFIFKETTLHKKQYYTSNQNNQQQQQQQQQPVGM